MLKKLNGKDKDKNYLLLVSIMLVLCVFIYAVFAASNHLSNFSNFWDVVSAEIFFVNLGLLAVFIKINSPDAYPIFVNLISKIFSWQMRIIRHFLPHGLIWVAISVALFLVSKF